MRDTYSLYEAKAKLSAIVRQVRKGRRVVITVHGEPAVEIRPVEKGVEEELEVRLTRLEERGTLVRRDPAVARLEPVAKRAGALQRFLAERD